MMTLLAACSRNEHLPGVNFDFNGVYSSLPSFLSSLGATYTRNSTKYVLQNGALVALSANTFGTSYDPDTGLYGYLPETAATNLQTYSADFSNAAWTKTRASVTGSSGTAPDGTNTAWKLIEDTAANSHFITSASIASGTTYTFSVYAKAGSSSRYLTFNGGGLLANSECPVYDLENGIVDIPATSAVLKAASIVYIGNGWYRCIATMTCVATGTFVIAITNSVTDNALPSYTGDGSSFIYIWGAQVETGSYASSYIKTTGATASRSADVLTIPLSNVAGFNEAGYTLFVDFRKNAIEATQKKLFLIDGGDAANRAFTGINASDAFRTAVTSSSSTEADRSAITIGTTRFKGAYSCSANLFLRSTNGATDTSDTAGAMPVSPTTMRVGCTHLNSEQPNGYIFNAKLITKALTQNQINGLTS